MTLFSSLRSALLSLALLASLRAADTPVVTPTLAKPATVSAAAATKPVITGFEAFRPITRRNIFDPNRTGPAAEAEPRGDVIALVGTILSTKSTVAFFESSDPQYRKVLHEGESVAQFTVKKIGNDSVELMRDKTPLTLKISQQLRRPVGGDWAVESMDRSSTSAPASSSSTTRRARPAGGFQSTAPADATGGNSRRRRASQDSTNAQSDNALDFLFMQPDFGPPPDSAPPSEPSPNP